MAKVRVVVFIDKKVLVALKSKSYNKHADKNCHIIENACKEEATTLIRIS